MTSQQVRELSPRWTRGGPQAPIFIGLIEPGSTLPSFVCRSAVRHRSRAADSRFPASGCRGPGCRS